MKYSSGSSNIHYTPYSAFYLQWKWKVCNIRLLKNSLISIQARFSFFFVIFLLAWITFLHNISSACYNLCKNPNNKRKRKKIILEAPLASEETTINNVVQLPIEFRIINSYLKFARMIEWRHYNMYILL